MAKHFDTLFWLGKSHWLFISFSLIAAVVAILAEGPGQYVGLTLLGICIVVISSWSLIGKPTLYWTIAIVTSAILTIGWTVEEPEPVLFQSILITAAVAWQIERLSHSVALLLLLASVPFLATLGPNEAHWAWWNWSVGTLFMWSLGRVIRLLENTLQELTNARAQLIDITSKNSAREERLRISRDVHDLVGHSLTAMLLNIRAAQRLMDASNSNAQNALLDAERVGTMGIADIRTALVDLRSDPSYKSNASETLSSLPDGETVLSLLDQQEHICVTKSGEVSALKGPLAIVVYRILQECITNILKYALKNSAKINLEITADEVILTAENRMDLINVSAFPDHKTLGLISMRERATSLGGTFSAGADRNIWTVDCRLPRHG